MIQLRRILHPTDFSKHAGQALLYAKELAHRFEAELHGLHVIPSVAAYPLEPGGYFVAPTAAESKEQARIHAGELLAGQVDEKWKQQHTYKTAIREGREFVAIIEYARETDIDLIVLGTHGHSALVQMLIGGTAEKVVRKAPCPVLTVRPEGHQFVMP